MKEKETNTAFDMLKDPEKTEIASGMTTEEIKAMFFDANALREPKYRVYRLDSNNYRYYYRFNESGEPEFYQSVTTLLRQVMPTSPFLIQWMIDNGKDAATEKRDLSAAYGTLMHMEFEKLIISRKYDFDAVPNVVREYMEQNNLPEKFFGDSVMKLRKDVLAFAQFIKDYNVKPFAIEIGLVHPQYKYAGCVDMPCEMTDKGKTFRAIVDFKSGRKGFFEEHEIQLHLYMMMWNVNFPDDQIERVFNFSPKDWRKKPTYNLKEQTDSPNAEKIPALLQLASIEDDKRDNTMTLVQGCLSLDDNEPMNNVLSISLAELVKSKATKDEKAEIRPNFEAKEEKQGNTPLPEESANTGVSERNNLNADLFSYNDFQNMGGRIIRPETPQGLEFPEIGRLHIGMKSEKGYPMSIDWFRATGKYADKFVEAYGEKPNTIQIVFPSDNVENVCNERFEYRDNAGALLSDGDGKTFRLWNGKSWSFYSTEKYPDFMQWVATNYPTKKGMENWSITLTLNFIIPKIRGIMGAWRFTTKGSASSVNNIRNSFDSVMQMRGSVTTSVFDLSVHFHKSNKPNDNSRYPVVDLIANDTRIDDIRNVLKPESNLKLLKND